MKLIKQLRLLSLLIVILLTLAGCAKPQQKAAEAAEEEPEARTEFTRRVENFFEYAPLKAGKQSQFRIHLTDLSDGAPVEQADVVLTVKAKGGSTEVAQTKARVGKVTGIYVADLTVPAAGQYDIEFHIKNNKLDEHIPLSDFKVE